MLNHTKNAIYVYVIIVVQWSSAQTHKPVDTILSDVKSVNDKGYYFQYETSNGIFRQEIGVFDKSTTKNAEEDDTVVVVDGTVRYIGDDGLHFKLNYHADENGYRPKFTISKSVVKTVGEGKPFVPFIGTAAIASLTGGGLG